MSTKLSLEKINAMIYALPLAVEGEALADIQEALIELKLLKELNGEMFRCLKRIIYDLPSKRDWLDPQLEYESRSAIAKVEGRNEPAKIN